MSKMMDMLKELETVEYAPEEETAIVEAVEAVIEERNTETAEINSELETVKAELEAAKQSLADANERAVEVEVESEETNESLTGYLKKLTGELSATRTAVDKMSEWRETVEERVGALTSIKEETEARHAEVEDESKGFTPELTDEDIKTAQGKQRGCDALWTRYMNDFKEAHGHIWDEDFDGDPYRGQTVRLMQSQYESRPSFIPRD